MAKNSRKTKSKFTPSFESLETRNMMTGGPIAAFAPIALDPFHQAAPVLPPISYQTPLVDVKDGGRVTFGDGGAVLSHVKVTALYYGKDWSTDATLGPQSVFLDGFLKNVVQSSYMDMLTNAGYGVGRGTASVGAYLPKVINKSQYLTDTQIRSDLIDMVSKGQLIAPDANQLFVVYVEPGVRIQDDTQVDKTGKQPATDTNRLGWHGEFEAAYASRAWFKGQIVPLSIPADFHYAIIAYPARPNFTSKSQKFLSDFQQMTAVTSHELAEAVTDPDLTTGWYDRKTGQEIGDIVNTERVMLNGYCVQKESDQFGNAMSPAGSSPYVFKVYHNIFTSDDTPAPSFTITPGTQLDPLVPFNPSEIVPMYVPVIVPESVLNALPNLFTYNGPVPAPLNNNVPDPVVTPMPLNPVDHLFGGIDQDFWK